MTSRKNGRNNSKKNEHKLVKNAKTRLIIMIISIIVMIFSITQVYYLAKYTLGHEVAPENLKVYKWVQLLLSGDIEKTT